MKEQMNYMKYEYKNKRIPMSPLYKYNEYDTVTIFLCTETYVMLIVVL